ncbi:MAG: hypothetical protein M1838_002986 [Thelocarpon superellum]|nr:MAG: hypothetical protein M1838_002986 [Thelocarpon superellum]
MAPWQIWQIWQILLAVPLAQLISAQLTGTLTSFNDTPEVIEAIITNPTSTNISVVALNNIFDLLHRSAPVKAVGSNGTAVPVAASHLMYDGLFLEDLFTLAPGENFTRDFNLSYYVRPDDAGDGPVTVAIHSHFQGIIGDDFDGALAINETTNTTNLIGELAAVNLSSIAVTAANLSVQLPRLSAFPIAKRVILIHDEDESDVDIGPTPTELPRSGITVDSKTCKDKRASRMAIAIRDADLLAVAGANAATKGNYPLNYFFRSSDTDAVTRIMERVHSSVMAETGSAAVDIMCEDVKSWCRRKRAGRIRGYADNKVIAKRDESLAYVVMCPSAMSASENPDPCSSKPDQVLRLGYVLLHELMHVDAIADGRHIGDLEYGVPGCHSLVGNWNPASPRFNADNYAWLASWAWDLGFGNWTGEPCPTKWFQSA